MVKIEFVCASFDLHVLDQTVVPITEGHFDKLPKFPKEGVEIFLQSMIPVSIGLIIYEISHILPRLLPDYDSIMEKQHIAGKCKSVRVASVQDQAVSTLAFEGYLHLGSCSKRMSSSSLTSSSTISFIQVLKKLHHRFMQANVWK
jgi:hypothetical protein